MSDRAPEVVPDPDKLMEALVAVRALNADWHLHVDSYKCGHRIRVSPGDLTPVEMRALADIVERYELSVGVSEDQDEPGVELWAAGSVF